MRQGTLLWSDRKDLSHGTRNTETVEAGRTHTTYNHVMYPVQEDKRPKRGMSVLRPTSCFSALRCIGAQRGCWE